MHVIYMHLWLNCLTDKVLSHTVHKYPDITCFEMIVNVKMWKKFSYCAAQLFSSV